MSVFLRLGLVLFNLEIFCKRLILVFYCGVVGLFLKNKLEKIIGYCNINNVSFKTSIRKLYMNKQQPLSLNSFCSR